MRKTIYLLLLLMWSTSVAIAQEPLETIHVVQAEDTLFTIAEKYLGDGYRYPDIVTATQTRHATDPTFAALPNINLLDIGDKLLIPTATIVSPNTSAPSPTPPPSTMPQGQIAFSFWNNAPNRCTYEINIIDVSACLTDAASCQANRRIFPLDNASEPALSPDGTRLAYRGWGGIPDDISTGQSHPYRGCSPQSAERLIQTATLEGADIRHITAFHEDGHPDWSPDGTRLLFDTARLGDDITRLMFMYANTTGEDHHTIQAEALRIAGEQPSWATDSQRFVYRGCDITGNQCGLWLGEAIPVQAWDVGINMHGPILENPAASQPDWSPVDEKILYQAPVDGNWDIYMTTATGTEPQRLTTKPSVDGLPTWSPDGQWVAYLSDEGGSWGIWLMRPDGTEQQQLFAFDGGQFVMQAVEPYGSRNWYDEQISWSR